jgi:hypothetical protein
MYAIQDQRSNDTAAPGKEKEKESRVQDRKSMRERT